MGKTPHPTPTKNFLPQTLFRVFFGGVISTNRLKNASIPTHFLFYGRDIGSMLILFALEGFLKILAIGGING